MYLHGKTQTKLKVGIKPKCFHSIFINCEKMSNQSQSTFSSFNENNLLEKFDYEPNSDDTSFFLSSFKTESSISIFTVESENSSGDLGTVETEITSETRSSDSGISIFTVYSDPEDEPLPTIKCWEELFTLTFEKALDYGDYLEDNIIDIPRVFFKLVNDQLAYIRTL